MKRLLICLLLFFFLVFRVNAEDIKNFDSKIAVNKDGTIDVEETIVYDFGEADKHGIYRTIPYVKENNSGKKFKLELSSFSVADETGNSYRFSKLDENGRLKLKIGDADKTITGIHTYVINYKTSGALTYFSDHDELYWNITGNDWEVPIEKVSTKVMLPDSLKQEEINGKCYEGVYGSAEAECEVKQDKNEIIFNSVNLLGIGEGLTIAVKFPIDIVAHLEPKELISFWDTFLGKVVIGLISLIGLIWYLILPFYIVYKWYTTGRDPKGIVGVTTAWFDPPKSVDNKRFLTPGEIGTLGDETVDLKDISATIVDLARRGYLKIEERDKKDFYLTKIENNKPLLSYERLLIDEFFGSEKEIRLKDKHLYEEVEKVKKSLYEQTVTDGLFPKNPVSVRSTYYFIAALALFTFNLPLAFISFVFGRIMPKKTVEGVNAKNVATSLKNFLTSQKIQLEFQADKQMMFERLLPYAVAFGVEKIWAKRFESLNLKEPDWYQGYSSGRFNSYIFVNSLNSSMSSFRSAATPTRSSSGFSSGFSGGFSGGGGGGGGGGSW
jgi:uncharacterized membrane protein